MTVRRIRGVGRTFFILALVNIDRIAILKVVWRSGLDSLGRNW